ncbi:MAG: glycosyltransferase, partial [Planctomycetes bacterium]|nr:glycosyltransferase [Planctomycetota bacterium]
MRKIKILQVITRLIAGGAQHDVVLLAKRSNFLGFETALASIPEGEYFQEVKKEDIRFFPIPEFRRQIDPLNDIKAFFRLYKIIKKEKFDIVHTHTSKAGVLG